jgi:succinate dehydrogenase / fumarate reductase cytochrome b subunit
LKIGSSDLQTKVTLTNKTPMLGNLGRALSASIGKKAWMAISGLLLVGFLIAHLAGNLLLFIDQDGSVFNSYAETLSSNPLLPVAELILATLFIAHIALGLRVSSQNREARKQRYRVTASHGGRTAGSATMLVTGILILIFLVIHILDFRLDETAHDDMALAVRNRLGSGSGAWTYGIGVAALGLHLSHAFSSAFQTLGINHPKYDLAIKLAGRAIGVILGLGFLAFPVIIYFTSGAS